MRTAVTFALSVSVALAALSPLRAHGKTVSVAGLDCAAIRSAIAQARAGDTVLLPAGTYAITESILPKSGIKLVGAGQDKTVLRLAGEKPCELIRLARCEDVTVSDLALDGAGSGLVPTGIHGHDCRRLSLVRLTIRNLTSGERARAPHAIHFTGSAPARSGGVTDSVIADCIIQDIGVGAAFGSGIRLSWGSSRNQVLRCRIDHTGRGGIFGNDGSSDLVIRDNVVTRSGGEMLGIEVWGGCDRCVIEDNRIDHWLSIGGCDWCSVRRNTISASDGTYGFIGIESIGSYLVFTDNLVDDAQVIGLSSSGPDPKRYHYYGNNTVRRCTQWGAQFQGEKGGFACGYFYRCRFDDTTTSRGKVIYKGDAGHGFRINGNVRHVTWEECEFRDNGRFGLQLGGADVDGLSFLRCTISGNKSPAVVGPGAYHPGQPAPYTALEWVACQVSKNGSDALPPAKPLAGPAPDAAFDMPATAKAGQVVRCTARTKTATTGLAKSLWDLGTGPPAAGDEATCTYDRAGTCRVTRIVWDPAGRAGRAERTIEIREAGTRD